MNSFGSRSALRVGNREFEIYRLNALEQQDARSASSLFASHSAETCFAARRQSGKGRYIRALASWSGNTPVQEIASCPVRAAQDFTGVPAVVDLAAMRDAMKA